MTEVRIAGQPTRRERRKSSMVFGYVVARSVLRDEAISWHLGEEPLCCPGMSLDQFAFLHRNQLSFFHHKLSANNRVIGIDGLPEDNRSDRIMHTAKSNPVHIYCEEVRALSTFQTAYITSSNHSRSPTRAKIERFTSGHQFSIGIVR